MKKTFLKATAALVVLALFIAITPAQLESEWLPWARGDAQESGRISYLGYYIAKRQWLADMRTLASGICYIYQSNTPSSLNPLHLAHVPRWLFPQADNSTNLLSSTNNLERA